MRSSDDQSLGAGAVDAAVTSLMPAVTYAAMAPGDVKIVAIVSRAGGKIVVLT
jgi:ABC-type nitrate/sulfonate/bicarbonate transport system substrate-binding protein